MRNSRRMSWKLVGQTLLLTILLFGCGTAPEEGLFNDADLTFDVKETTYRNCQTGDALAETPSPEHALTRAGLRWHDDGRQLDFLLEYGGIDEYPARTFTWIGFVDRTRTFSESNDGSDHAHNRMHFGVQLQWGDKNYVHNHLWKVTSDGEWLKGVPAVIRYGDEIEISGNQVRMTVPKGLMEVSGPKDPRLANLSWHVSTGDEDDRTHFNCIGSGLENPWPVDLEALASLRIQ